MRFQDPDLTLTKASTKTGTVQERATSENYVFMSGMNNLSLYHLECVCLHSKILIKVAVNILFITSQR